MILVPRATSIRRTRDRRSAAGRAEKASSIAGFIGDAHTEHSAALESYLAERAAAEEAAANGVAIPGVDDFTLAVLDRGIRYEQAMVDWLTHLPARIDGGDPAERDATDR